MKPKVKKILLAILAIWTVVFAVDFLCIVTWHRPVFCIRTIGYDDGGSGIYAGLGYWYHIKGNFMPEEDDRVTEYSLKLAGISILEAENNES